MSKAYEVHLYTVTRNADDEIDWLNARFGDGLEYVAGFGPAATRHRSPGDTIRVLFRRRTPDNVTIHQNFAAGADPSHIARVFMEALKGTTPPGPEASGARVKPAIEKLDELAQLLEQRTGETVLDAAKRVVEELTGLRELRRIILLEVQADHGPLTPDVMTSKALANAITGMRRSNTKLRKQVDAFLSASVPLLSAATEAKRVL